MVLPMRALLVLLSLLMFGLAPARAASLDAEFQAWLASDLWPEAKRAGISEAVFSQAFDGVSPDLDLPDLVLHLGTRVRLWRGQDAA